MNSSEPTGVTFDQAKTQALSLRDEIEKTLPAEAVVSASDNDIRLPCGDDAAQFDGNRTLVLSSQFDRVAWLDSVAAAYSDRDGWTVEKDVKADGSSDATAAVSLISSGGYFLRLGEFSDAGDGDATGPVLVLSASGPCVAV